MYAGTLCCHTFSVYYLLRCAVISSWFSVENLYVLIGVLVLFHLTLGLTPPLATNQSPERRSIQILLASSAKHKATYGKLGYANIMEVLSTLLPQQQFCIQILALSKFYGRNANIDAAHSMLK